MQHNRVILFDGVCNFCNYWVNFIIKRDRQDLFRFAPLQGEAARKIIGQYGLQSEEMDTFILIENNKIYTRSTAALKIAKELKGGWKLFYGFILLPKIFRDPVYNLVARNRYKWFGKKEECMVPSDSVKKKFLL